MTLGWRGRPTVNPMTRARVPVQTEREWPPEVVGSLAYVADGSSGLRVIDFGPEYVPEPTGIVLQATALLMLGALVRRRVRG